MNPTLDTDHRPEAMADVPGVCELPLTRAVVQYRDVHEIDMDGGRIQDIGLALVLEGRYASAAEAVDLGSAEVKLLDLSSELIVLDWVYEPTLEHLVRLVSAAARGASGQRDELAPVHVSTRAAATRAGRVRPAHPADPAPHRLP